MFFFRFLFLVITTGCLMINATKWMWPSFCWNKKSLQCPILMMLPLPLLLLLLFLCNQNIVSCNFRFSRLAVRPFQYFRHIHFDPIHISAFDILLSLLFFSFWCLRNVFVFQVNNSQFSSLIWSSMSFMWTPAHTKLQIHTFIHTWVECRVWETHSGYVFIQLDVHTYRAFA